MAKVHAVPKGLRTITVQLTIDGCDQAIEWYRKAFGAELKSRAPDPSGKKVWHAEMHLGDSAFFLNDAFPEMGGVAQPTTLWIYADDIDQRFKRAVDAGAKVTMPLGDQFWGDRTGQVVDPYGNKWNLAQHVKDLTPEQMKKAEEAFIASMPKK